MNISKALNSAGKFISRHSPEILTGLGVAGVGVTAWLSAKYLPRAKKIFDSVEFENATKNEDRKKLIEAAKTCAPPFISGGLTAACIIASNRISHGRISGLNNVLACTRANFEDYKGAVLGYLGSEGAKQVKENAMKKSMEERGMYPREEDIVEDGKVLFYDEFSRREFYAKPEDVADAIAEFNKKLHSDFCGTINDFYRILGIDEISGGDDFGWDMCDLMSECIYWLDIYRVRHEGEGNEKEWYSIEMDIWPYYDFEKDSPCDLYLSCHPYADAEEYWRLLLTSRNLQSAE